MSLVCIYVQGSQFVLIMSMLKFTGVLKQLCKQKLPMLNFFSNVFQLILSPSCMIIVSNGLVLFAFFNGLIAERVKFFIAPWLLSCVYFLMDWTSEGSLTAALSLNASVQMEYFSIYCSAICFPWMVGMYCCTNSGNYWELLFLKNVYFLNHAVKNIIGVEPPLFSIQS